MPTKCCNRSTGTMYQLYTYISQSIFVAINNRVGTYFHQTWLFRCCHLYYLNGVGGLVDRTVAKDHTKQQAIKFRVRKCSKKTFQVRHLAAPAAQSHHISHTIGAFAPTAHPGRFVTSPYLNLTSFTSHSPYSLTFTLTPNSGAHGGDVRLRSQSGHGRATAAMFPASEWQTCNVHLCQCACRYSVRSRYVYDRDRVCVDMVIR